MNSGRIVAVQNSVNYYTKGTSSLMGEREEHKIMVEVKIIRQRLLSFFFLFFHVRTTSLA